MKISAGTSGLGVADEALRIPKVEMDTCRQKKKGRPKTTWRKTVETELSEMDLSWGKVQAIAKAKTWRKSDIVVAPYPTGGNKD